MLSILIKTGPRKISEDLWRVLGKNGFHCSLLEISREGSLHQGRLLSDDFFELNHGQRRRKKNGFVLECQLSIPEFWHLPLVGYPGPFQISIQGEDKRENWKKPNNHKKECKWGKQNRAVRTTLSYPFGEWVISLSRGIQLWQKKLWVPSIESYMVFLQISF